MRNPLVIILVVAGLISGLVGDLVDAGLIFTIVALGVMIDSYQANKARKAVELLRRRVPATATVLREGAKTGVEFSRVVPGEIVMPSAGDVVLAD